MSERETAGFLVVIGGSLASLLAYLGWESRSVHKQLQDLPEKYVLKTDHSESNRIVREEMHEMKIMFHDGLNRIHDRLDDLSKRG